ncbi:hypothetical protein Tco_1513353, partial [Tanacetum coccineum]
MSTLAFAETHNLVAYLEKPSESAGFEQIVDFLNAHPIRYALTVNPTIYVSCIKQFCNSTVSKTVNEEVQIHATVDGKKIVITESSVRRTLHLVDDGGVDCLPTSAIFENLALLGYETTSQKLTFYKSVFAPQWKFLIHTILQCLSPKQTAWNEFSSVIASAIICLATDQKFNFSKLIFDGMLRNLDNAFGKILMYPWPGKGFTSNVTPLTPTMVALSQTQMGEGSVMPTNTQHIPTFMVTSSSAPQKTQKHRKPKRKSTKIPQSSGPTDIVADEAVHKERSDSLERAASTVASLDAEQDNGNIDRTQSKAIPTEPSFQETSSGGGPGCQETIGDIPAQTRFERVSNMSNDPLLAEGNTSRSGED